MYVARPLRRFVSTSNVARSKRPTAADLLPFPLSEEKISISAILGHRISLAEQPFITHYITPCRWEKHSVREVRLLMIEKRKMVLLEKKRLMQNGVFLLPKGLLRYPSRRVEGIEGAIIGGDHPS